MTSYFLSKFVHSCFLFCDTSIFRKLSFNVILFVKLRNYMNNKWHLMYFWLVMTIFRRHLKQHILSLNISVLFFCKVEIKEVEYINNRCISILKRNIVQRNEATTISTMENISSYAYNCYVIYIIKEYSPELYTF